MPEFAYIGAEALYKKAMNGLTHGVVSAAHDLEARAKGAAPVDTGTLRASIHTTGPRVSSFTVSAQVRTGGEAGEYAVFVHEGTGPHEIRAHGKALAFDGHFAKAVHHPGTPAFKYIEGPLISMAGAYKAMIAAAAAGEF